MQHFALIQSLCRVAMSNPNPALTKQVERLRNAMQEAGESKEAAALSAILTSAERAEDMTPSKLTRSLVMTGGETLTRNTVIPVDRETSTPLAQVIFQQQIPEGAPIFSRDVSGAIKSLLEEWSHLEAFDAAGIKPSKTCLIYGAPGTGKTRLAMWMAKQLDLPVVVARLDSLVSSFLGTSSRNIGTLFNFVNRFRCVLLLDEFDALAKLRDDPQEVGEIKRIVNALLQNLDTREPLGFTIGITNHPQLLDPAVWRRFEVQLQIPNPDTQLRLDMARLFMMPTEAPESHLKLFAWFTEGATGAELEAVVRSYKKLRAVRGDKPYELLDLFRQFATLNSGRLNAERRHLLQDPADLLEALHRDTELSFSQAELGEIINKDKSTISRMLNSRNKSARSHG
ncbi:AAA family ATPase [Bradyrhizobium pachyrhizi]|uniref:AAA family ATPase n=1 Tax=Bradyrhizobium pachyrhizi TaxID=280333 RepID=A0A844ST73_9BRAD|nr:ATP-binding protein [Bradyrhizobium pachyrhizi]MVT69457.1 AAA family ATPase [Bradyrhizobium pachyrhizi]